MPTQKRIDGDYVITTINPFDDVIVNTNTFTINGNLNVVGNLTTIETTELKVDDPFITVAANNTGTVGTAVFQQQGLVTQTSGSTFAGLRFNNDTLTWQVSPDVDANGAPISNYANIGLATAGSVGGPLNSVQFHDAANVFGGNAYYSVDVANSRVILQGDQLFGNIGTAPAAVANSVAVFHNAEGVGGTGLYVRSSTVQDELISATKAIAFGLIL